VFRAVRDSDGEHVALKILKKAFIEDETFRRRFVHEAGRLRRSGTSISSRSSRPERSTAASIWRFAYIRGCSLAQRITEGGPLHWLRRSTSRRDRCRLDALHDHGLVHRDVKSANVLLDENDTALLTDFGLAKGRAYTVLTKAGQVMGTLDYLRRS